MTDFTLPAKKKLELKEAEEKQREAYQKEMALKQLETQKLYNQELKNSYKGVLNDQINQHSLQKDQEKRLKQDDMVVNKQRQEMQKQ